MTDQQEKIAQLRVKLMQNRKVLCTGNPNNKDTLAYGFKQIFPDATFIHASAGWDLTDQSEAAQQRLKEVFSKHNTFINASYIAPYVQSFLLDMCYKSVKFCDVFNIGSTHEYDGLGKLTYRESKLDLRDKSLQLNSYRFQTHHIMIGSIRHSTDQTTLNRLPISTICNVIPWITQQEFKVPLICIDQDKQAW